MTYHLKVSDSRCPLVLFIRMFALPDAIPLNIAVCKTLATEVSYHIEVHQQLIQLSELPHF